MKIINNDYPKSNPEVLVKRGRGRPSLGKPILIRLNEQETEVARLMGDGLVSAGVRMALHAVSAVGFEVALKFSLQSSSEEIGATSATSAAGAAVVILPLEDGPAVREKPIEVRGSDD